MGAYVAIPLTLSGMNIGVGGSNPFNTACNIVIITFSSLSLLINHKKSAVAIIFGGGVIHIIFILAIASITWSIEPTTTARRVLSLLTCILFSFHLITSHSVEEIIKRVAIACLTIAIASTAVCLLAPKIGISTPAYPAAWNGVFPHKNQLGWAMIIGVNAYGWVLVHSVTWKLRIRYALIILYFVIIAFLAQSTTAIVTQFLLLFFGTSLRVTRMPGSLKYWGIFSVIIVFCCSAVIFQMFLVEILSLFDKDPELTGRIPLWRLLITFVLERPLSGYGYGAFWVDQNPRVQWVQHVIKWAAQGAHSAYIDIALQLGIPGIILSIWTLVVVLAQSARLYARYECRWASFAFTFSVAFAITNINETALYSAPDIYCVILPVCYIAVRLTRLNMLAPLTRPTPARTRRGGRSAWRVAVSGQPSGG